MHIINADCLEAMPTLPENSVDAIVTDPPYGLSFMGKDWDHGVPGVEFWKAAYRVMKPGAFLLAFGGTRTHHRLTVAIEDAGFEIRDCMMWLYGSGFPKSHDVSKAIDREAGAERKIIETIKKTPSASANCNEGWVRPWADGKTTMDITAPSTDSAKKWSGWGTALKPAWEPIIVARKPLEGTVAQNVLKWGTGAINIDGGRIGTNGEPLSIGSGKIGKNTYGEFNRDNPGQQHISGRWPANVILDEESGRLLDGQSGTLKSGGSGNPHQSSNSLFVGTGGNAKDISDSGGASRFFYCAKTSKRERGEGNNHPTVKPQALMSYLIKLVCPLGGIVLDPFMGSGSTGIAAVKDGFSFIGIEKEAAYAEIASKRIGAI